MEPESWHMTNWRPIATAPKDGRELTARRFVHGQTDYECVAVWRADTDEWIDPITGNAVAEPTHWKAKGRGHPERIR
jgi:hypothetical protein